VIFVTVGSSGLPFDRLLREIERIAADDELLVQHGPSQIKPRNAHCVPFMHFAELERTVASARIVITHAGAGSILLSLMNRKRPIVVPRNSRYGEVVDDHQEHFAERLARDSLVTLVLEPADLARVVAEQKGDDAPAEARAGTALESELRGYFRQKLDGSR
jgi:UDP-N-acetylglucosamine transferase subunit ALG13